MDDEEKNRVRMEVVANYISLPFVLAIPPIIGWYAGSWLDRYFGTAPYCTYILLVLGIASGGREFYRIVKKYKDKEL